MADLITRDQKSSDTFRAGRTRPARKGFGRRDAIAGYLFVSPSVLGFLVFVLGPLLAAFWFSFTRYDVISPPTFIGLDNYTRLFSDQRLGLVYLNTIIYVVAAVVLINGLGLLFAVLINVRMPSVLTYVFRSFYFFPSLVALAYIALI